MIWPTAVCIASGPSLTAQDCKTIEESGLPTVAVNSAWTAARFAQVIYAGDDAWWKLNVDKIDIEAERWTNSENTARTYNLKYHAGHSGNPNSGLRAIQFLHEKYGAQKIILLGFDCSVKNGLHFHGPHAYLNNPTDKRCNVWLERFRWLSDEYRQKWVQVINCSRETAITVFPRMSLQEALYGGVRTTGNGVLACEV